MTQHLSDMFRSYSASQHHFVRVWLACREAGTYPTAEEMLVAAPALVKDKAKTSFESSWEKSFLPLVA